MAAELSKVLDHIEAIRELDLEGVPPTSHVIDVVNVLRADEPEPSLPREVILAAGSRAGQRRLRRPQPRRGVSELIELTAAQAAERVRAGRSPPTELFEAYRARAAANELNAFTWVADGAPEANGQATAPLGGVPIAVKDLFCTEGVPSQSGSKILEGYRPPYTATVVAKLAEAGAPLLGKTNQDEFAMGSSNENSAFGPVLNPWDRTPGPRRLLGRERGGGRGRAGAVGDRHRHRRIDPPARGAVRHRGAQAHLRRVLALRDDRVRLLARSGRPAHPRRDRRGAAPAPHDRARPARLHLARVPGRDRAAARGGPEGHAARGARGAHRRRGRDRAGGAGELRGDAQARRGASARRSSRAGCRTRRRRCRPTT